MSQLHPTIAEANAYAASYIIKNCMTTAFRAAFPQSKAAQQTTWNMAHLLHKKKEVLVRIEQLSLIAREAADLEHATSSIGIMQSLDKIAKRGMENITNGSGEQVPINLSASTGALQEINRMKGHHANGEGLSGGTQVTVNNWNIYPTSPAVIDITPDDDTQIEPPDRISSHKTR